MECEHCKNKFKTKSILKNHQKTATYCKVLQQDIGIINIINIKIYRCEFCNKDLSQKIDLQRHYQICKKKEISLIDKNYQIIIDNIEKQNFMIWQKIALNQFLEKFDIE